MPLDFVNREESIQKIEKTLRQLSNGGAMEKPPIFEFRGPSGIGKTKLLKEIERRSALYNVPCWFIDVTRPQSINQSGNESKTSRFEALQKNFAICEHAQCGVLLLDAVNSLDIKEREWLESQVVSLTANGQRAVILSGNFPNGWKWPNRYLRTNIDKDVLRPFTTEYTRQQIQHFSYGEFSDAIHCLTGGFPYGNDFIQKRLQQIEEKRGDKIKRTEFELYEKALFNELWLNLRGMLLSNVDDNLLAVLQILSIPLRFDVEGIMNELLSRFISEDKGDLSNAPQLLADISAKNLVEWFDDGINKGYRFHPEIEVGLRLSLRYKSNERYIEICQAVIEYWERQLVILAKKNEANLSLPIMECLYHYINILRAQSIRVEDLQVKVLQQLRNYLDNYFQGNVGFDRSKKFCDELERNLEFKEYAGMYFAPLLQEVSSFRDVTKPQQRLKNVDEIDQRVNIEGLRELCFRVSVDFDNLKGESKRAKIIALVDYCDKRGELERLMQEVRRL